MSSDVRFVCFDLGGVLVKIATGWDDACRRAGVSLDHHDPAAWQRHRGLLARYESGELDEPAYLARVAECLPGVATDDVSRFFDAYLLGLYPGAEQLLLDLRAAGLVTGCLSNTNQRHWRTLTQHADYAPLRHLHHRFASHETRTVKPAADAYHHVERATGFGGDQILFFDDRQENVDAAKTVGWRAEHVGADENPLGQLRQMLKRRAIL